MMSGIRGKNTKPEILIRSLVHRGGFRFRIHAKRLPGHPDLVLPKHRAVIFVHGCFWHGHGCYLFKWPSSNKEFWKAKIRRNQAQDRRVNRQLAKKGWRVGIVWECALKGRTKHEPELIAKLLEGWITSTKKKFELGEA